MNRTIQAIFYGNPDQYPPIINSARLLAESGFELDIFCRWDAQQWDVSYPPEVRIHRVKTDTGGPWFEYLSFVVKVLRRAKLDAVLFIGHDMHGLFPARIISTFYRRPIIYHCHDFAENDRQISLGSQAVRTFERRFARTSDVVIVPDADRALVVDKELRLKRPPLVCANAPLIRYGASGEALHRALAKNGHRFEAIVLRQGRVGPGHAIESTLRSVPLWGNSNWGFVLMGISDSDYLTRLNAQARALGVDRQFAVLPPVGYDKVALYTPGADIGHALYEPIHINNEFIATASNKIMEYMEAGIPLLVSDTPALKRLVKKHGCGVTADERSPESIAAAINILLGQPERARMMGSAGRKSFEEEFCFERQFAPVVQVVKRLANID
ncbi:MAG: glycosyltransferase [Pyrinomonadaceae bacterium]